MRAKRKPERKAEPGYLLLILAAIILTTVGMFLRDARGVAFETYGGLIWLAALLVSFLFGLLFYAQFVLPLRGAQGWAEGLRLLWRHNSVQASRYLNERFGGGRAKRPRHARGKQPVPSLPASFRDLRAGIIPSHQVLALSQRNSYARPAGPGFVMLYDRERASHLIDLRVQIRRRPVKANTRDGIPIETNVTAVFQVQMAPTVPPDEQPYPYDRDAIFHVAHTATYISSPDAKDALKAWNEQIAPRAAALLTQEIARYTLDELFQAQGGGPSTLTQLKTAVKRQLERQVVHQGIDVLAIAVDRFELPDKVMNQRIRAWQAEWQRKIDLQLTASDAEAVRRIKKARARAQVEIIENITQNIAAMRRLGDADLSEIITLRMIEALEEARSDTTLVTLLPQQIMANLVLDTSAQMQTWLKRGREEQ